MRGAERKGRIGLKIGFVGLGNMATAIIGGLLREGTTFSGEDGDATVITAANIIGSAKTEEPRQKRAEQFGIAVTASNREVAEVPMCWCFRRKASSSPK